MSYLVVSKLVAQIKYFWSTKSVAKNGCTNHNIFWQLFHAEEGTAILGNIRYACDLLTLVKLPVDTSILSIVMEQEILAIGKVNKGIWQDQLIQAFWLN